jgi:hypothetical protein
MYWDNPLISLRWPSSRDPIVESFHNATHCLFYNAQATFEKIQTNQRLQDLCNWANSNMQSGLDNFINEPNNHYDIANLIKLNMWIADIKLQGIVKPWLILDQGNDTYIAGTGESRLRCLECIPEITHVPAFISTHCSRAEIYSELEQIKNFDRFAELCQARHGQEFLFRLTDPTAPYGIYWYEFDSERTRTVTPGQQWCVDTFANYARQQSTLNITKEWFAELKDWQTFAN